MFGLLKWQRKAKSNGCCCTHAPVIFFVFGKHCSTEVLWTSCSYPDKCLCIINKTFFGLCLKLIYFCQMILFSFTNICVWENPKEIRKRKEYKCSVFTTIYIWSKMYQTNPSLCICISNCSVIQHLFWQNLHEIVLWVYHIKKYVKHRIYGKLVDIKIF